VVRKNTYSLPVLILLMSGDWTAVCVFIIIIIIINKYCYSAVESKKLLEHLTEKNKTNHLLMLWSSASVSVGVCVS